MRFNHILKPAWILLAALLAHAETPTASITGFLADSGGGALVGAQVVLEELDTGIKRSTATNEAGVYQLPGLRPGRYELTASAPGFAASRRTNIVVRVSDELRIDLALSLAGTRESVEVTESAPLVQTESGAASAVVGSRAIQDLPADGRQLQNLALILPGVSAGWNVSTAANRYGKARENTEGAFSVNGARSRSNDFLLDGMPMNLRQYSVINFEPSTEAVEEFAVFSAAPAAEYGRTMGGQVSIITRAGSNAFHGSAYEFLRNDALNANDTLSKRAGLPRGTVRHNQFGGSLGGPIRRNKHFFFVNAELLRNLEASETRTSIVPSETERRGLISHTDPAGAARVLDLSGLITPQSAALVSLYPLPNASSAAGNYNAPLAIRLNDSQFHVRTDHHLSERDMVTARVSWNLNDQTYLIDRFGGPYIPGFPLPNPERTANATIGYLRTFGPGLVNEARVGVNRYRNPLDNGDPRNAAEFGLPNGANANGIPSIVFAQGGLAGLGGLSWYNREQNELTVYAADSVSLLHGAHNLKFGAELSRYQFNTRGATDQRGSLFFDGSRNTLIPKTPENALANVLADLLLGLPFQATITVGQFGRGYREWATALFGQDSWRATKRLTLNYGLRYEYGAPWTEVNGKLSNFVPGLDLFTPQSPGWRGLYRPDRNNFSPRAGFAYDLSGRARTIVRGGFALMYETILQASTVQQIENNPPFSASAITTSPTPFPSGGGPARTLLDLRGAAHPSRSLSAIPWRLPNPHTLQVSFDVQQVLGASWVAELGYRGTRGVHLPLDYNLNQVPLRSLTAADRTAIAAASGTPAGTAPIVDALRPYPAFNSISMIENAATSSYHSLQARLERRYRSGLDLMLAYTWSKSIDDASDFASGDPSERVLDSFDRRSQKAVSSFDVQHRFVASFNYSLPAPFLRPVLKGWQANGIVTWQTGQPFTPYTSRFDPFRNDSYNRLNVVGNPNRDVPPGLAYNPAAFAAPSPGTFGNSGRNIIRGDGYSSADLSLFRNFVLRDSVRFQLRLEAVNALNQVNYQGPITDQATRPGAFVATAAPRLLQIGAKLSF